MTPAQSKQLKAHVEAIAQLLYADAVGQGMCLGSLGEIEQSVRSQILDHVAPEVGIFLSTAAPAKITDPAASW
jgi:hypothetical protein